MHMSRMHEDSDLAEATELPLARDTHPLIYHRRCQRSHYFRVQEGCGSWPIQVLTSQRLAHLPTCNPSFTIASQCAFWLCGSVGSPCKGLRIIARGVSVLRIAVLRSSVFRTSVPRISALRMSVLRVLVLRTPFLRIAGGLGLLMCTCF